MPQFNFWDERKEFVQVCQGIESKHAQPFLTTHVLTKLRKCKDMVKLRNQVFGEPTRYPSTAFYFPALGMTLVELALYDVVARVEPTSNVP